MGKPIPSTIQGFEKTQKIIVPLSFAFFQYPVRVIGKTIANAARARLFLSVGVALFWSSDQYKPQTWSAVYVVAQQIVSINRCFKK